jgi:hypothetical protein
MAPLVAFAFICLLAIGVAAVVSGAFSQVVIP